MLNIGLLGCGRIGQVHAQSLSQSDGARLIAIADTVTENADRLAEKTGGERRTVEAILIAKDIDAVIICTPTDTHFDLIQKAAQADKAIFCEKPVDMSVENIRALELVLKARGTLFMSGFNRRFDPNFSNIRNRIADGQIGDVEILTILSRDPSPPPIRYIEQSGGLFRDMMIHDFDMARFLLGDEPVQVFAVGSNLMDPSIGAAGDVDTAAVTLTTASGAICQISNSRRASYGYDQRVEVHGEKGMLSAANVLANQVQIATADGFQTAPTQPFFLERYGQAYLAEMRAFVETVADAAPLSPSFQDGLQAQILAEAADRSWRLGRPVRIADI